MFQKEVVGESLGMPGSKPFVYAHLRVKLSLMFGKQDRDLMSIAVSLST